MPPIRNDRNRTSRMQKSGDSGRKCKMNISKIHFWESKWHSFPKVASDAFFAGELANLRKRVCKSPYVSLRSFVSWHAPRDPHQGREFFRKNPIVHRGPVSGIKSIRRWHDYRMNLQVYVDLADLLHGMELTERLYSFIQSHYEDAWKQIHRLLPDPTNLT